MNDKNPNTATPPATPPATPAKAQPTVPPPTPPAPSPKKNRKITWLLVFFAVLAISNIWLFAANKKFDFGLGKTKPPPTPTPTITPTPRPTPTPYPLPTGPQTYRVGHGKDVKGPKMTEVTFDPFDPKVGGKQTITVKAAHTSPIKRVAITLETDNGQTVLYPLTLIEGTETNGTWQGSWTTEQKHDYVYNAHLELVADDNTFKGTLTLRYAPDY